MNTVFCSFSIFDISHPIEDTNDHLDTYKRFMLTYSSLSATLLIIIEIILRRNIQKYKEL